MPAGVGGSKNRGNHIGGVQFEQRGRAEGRQSIAGRRRRRQFGEISAVRPEGNPDAAQAPVFAVDFAEGTKKPKGSLWIWAVALQNPTAPAFRFKKIKNSTTFDRTEKTKEIGGKRRKTRF